MAEMKVVMYIYSHFRIFFQSFVCLEHTGPLFLFTVTVHHGRWLVSLTAQRKGKIFCPLEGCVFSFIFEHRS